jgi:hypothetical protein
MKHIVSTTVLQNILNYLASRPYSEVATLIKELQEDAKPLEDKVSE